MKAELLDRITLNPEIFGGKPIIRGVRIKVSNIIEFLAAGMTNEEILADYPYLALGDSYTYGQSVCETKSPCVACCLMIMFLG